jgi:hypothetical protein
MAVPVFCCGGECGRIAASGANVGEHWTALPGSGSVTIETTIVRSGARAIRLTGTTTTCSVSTLNLATATRWVARFYLRFVTALPSVDTVIAWPNSTTGPNLRFQQSDSKLYAAVGTTVGASGVLVAPGQWYRVDCDFNINTGGDDTSDVNVGGVACGQATGAGLSAGQSGFAVGFGSATADIIIDDLVLSQTAADYPLGAGYVNHFVPTADGAHNVAGANDFERGGTGTDITNATTTAYQLIDDVPLDDVTPDTDDYINMIAPPNATDYVECIFGPAPGISTPTTGPRAVEVIAGIHQAGTGTGNMEIRLNDNGSMGTIYTATTVAGTTTIIYKRAHFADPPSAASVWNAAGDGGNGDFLDLRMRFGSPAALDVNPDQFLDCIMIEAEFAEVTAVDTDWMPGPFVQVPPPVRNVGY